MMCSRDTQACATPHPAQKRLICFAIIVLQMYCYYKCIVALPHDAVGLSDMCECVISDHTH